MISCVSEVIKESTTLIGKIVEVKIDRPLGSIHPKHPDIIYGVNYGYVPGTLSGDGMEIDAYILNHSEAVEHFAGRCVAVIRRLKENDDKLIIVADGDAVTNEQIRAQTDFQEKFFESRILR